MFGDMKETRVEIVVRSADACGPVVVIGSKANRTPGMVVVVVVGADASWPLVAAEVWSLLIRTSHEHEYGAYQTPTTTQRKLFKQMKLIHPKNKINSR